MNNVEVEQDVFLHRLFQSKCQFYMILHCFIAVNTADLVIQEEIIKCGIHPKEWFFAFCLIGVTDSDVIVLNPKL